MLIAWNESGWFNNHSLCNGIWACPLIKFEHMLRSVKEDLGLRVQGVYRGLCSCGLGYTVKQSGPLQKRTWSLYQADSSQAICWWWGTSPISASWDRGRKQDSIFLKWDTITHFSTSSPFNFCYSHTASSPKELNCPLSLSLRLCPSFHLSLLHHKGVSFSQALAASSL